VETAQRKKGIDFQGPVIEAGICGLTIELTEIEPLLFRRRHDAEPGF
jgi:hypothetical protein